jgi:hypothetical protein
MVGHVTAGSGGCTPRWSHRIQGHEPLAARFDRLRAAGGDLRLAFGGPLRPELAATCPSDTRLAAAYSRVIGAYHAQGVDFEVRDSADLSVALRRAAAIVRLQEEARGDRRPLALSFTLPATAEGVAPADVEMLRATRLAGADIGTVNLLVPFTSGFSGNLHRLATAARSAHAQLQDALGATGVAVWRRMALTPVLQAAQDLSVAEARRLAAFRARTGLGWVSVRGATPAPDVADALASP